jgi:hypothetical protein
MSTKRIAACVRTIPTGLGAPASFSFREGLHMHRLQHRAGATREPRHPLFQELFCSRWLRRAILPRQPARGFQRHNRLQRSQKSDASNGRHMRVVAT